MTDGRPKDNREVAEKEKATTPETVRWADRLGDWNSSAPPSLTNPFKSATIASDTVKVESDPPPPQPKSDGPRLTSPFGAPLDPRPTNGWREIPGNDGQRENHHGGWPVRRFKDNEVPGPGPGPGPRPRGPLGPLDVPEPILKRPGNELDTRNSVFFNIDGRPLLLAGGLTGAAVRTGTWGLDKYTGSIAPEERTGWVKYWRDHFSPSQLEVAERQLAFQKAGFIVHQREAAVRLREQEVIARESMRRDLAASFRAEIPRTVPLSEIEQRFFNGRVELVADKTKFNRSNILLNAGTEAEVANRTKLFTGAEAQSVADHADRFWGSIGRRDDAIRCVRAAEEARDKAAKVVAEAERGSITTGGASLMKGLGQGIGIAALTVGADLALDKALGNNPELKPYTSWGLQGVGLPLIFLSRMSTPGKIVSSLGLIGVSHMVDRAIGPPTGMFSTFARPNVPEMVLVTGSLLAPVRDWRIKTAMVAGSWLAGRAYNLIEDKYEFGGKTQARLQSDARTYVEVDKESRSESTFAEAASRIKRFALENENAATLLVSDWQNYSKTSENLLEVQRGRAAILTGLGEARLEKGTRIDQREYDRGDRVLPGKNYDLGGEAANFLRSAWTSLDQCQTFARANIGKTFNGRAISEAEVQQYSKLKADVKTKLDVIYGAHEIGQIADDLKLRAESQPDELRKFAENLKDYCESLSDADPQYKSKILRDLVLLHIAFGRVAQDEASKNEHQRRALACLERAKILDGSAPDIDKLKKLLAI